MSQRRVNVLVVADTHVEARGETALIRALQGCWPAPEVVVHLGDFCAHSALSEYLAHRRAWRGFPGRLLQLRGNHDKHFLGKVWFRCFYGVGQRIWDVGFRGAVRLVTVDNGDKNRSFTERQLRFLRGALARGGTKLVFCHKPPGLEEWATHGARVNVERFCQVCAENGVALVVAGHLHQPQEKVRDAVRYVIAGATNCREGGFFCRRIVVADGSAELRDELLPAGEGQ